jgi:hypothetical protein
MANHLREQQTLSMCKLLLEELERVVNEELQLRLKLIDSGVRDVSRMITLPRNRLDKLDEESADYDDKRLCHACKHVCFFSAVACECSESKVSCLRHSHYMCRCPTERKYLMMWTDEEEMTSTLKRTREHYTMLKREQDGPESSAADLDKEAPSLLPPVAVGVERDLALNKSRQIRLEPFDPVSHALQGNYYPSVDIGLMVAPSHSSKIEIVIDDDSDSDIEVVAVRQAKQIS